MPEMTGYEVCERLKADERLKDIPVIFISALNETMDKVRAFSVGGVDYITKPFQFAEVESRVKTHLALRRQQRDLQESYRKLQELEALRDSLIHMIVHDLRTPLNGIYGFLQLLETTEKVRLTDKGVTYLARVMSSTVTLMDMVTALLDVNKMESGEMTLHLADCDLLVAARQVLVEVDALKGRRQLLLDAPPDLAPVAADPDLVRRVFQNLMGNALKFTPADGVISIAIHPGAEAVRVAIRDTGPGIPQEYHTRIFEKFGQVEARNTGQKRSTGLGLTFCKLAVEAHGGRIGVESAVGSGSTFWFELPCTAQTAHRTTDGRSRSASG
jgi:signal transduction histidine kinase